MRTEHEVRKQVFPALLKEATDKSFKPEILQNAFRKCGLVPWNIKAAEIMSKPQEETTTTVVTTVQKTHKSNISIGCLTKFWK